MKEQIPAQETGETTRIRYLPLARAEAEMVLGMPLVLVENGVVRYSLPAGHALNVANLEQLRAHHAEIVCVVEPDTRTGEEREAGFEAAEKTLDRVFKLADPDNLLIRNLRQTILEYRRR